MKIGIEARIENLKIVDSNGCWLSKNWRSSSTRPQILLDGKLYLLSRVIMWLNGKIQLGSNQLVLHNCTNEQCFNPEHLYVGNHMDNHKDKVRSGNHKGPYTGVTHCIHGHEFSKANTYIRPNGCRSCRECLKLRARKRKSLTRF